MKIDVDCPGCGKRYEVAESYAGKKSRCKQCGASFRIPSPSAETGGESNHSPAADRSAGAVSQSPNVQSPNGHHSEVTVPASPPIVSSGAASGTIVLNCPRCFKRYEVDSVLAGKKSRCKDCKEVFTIPAPTSPPAPPPREPAPSAKSSSLGLRNFTVIPEEVISRRVDEEFVDFEPVDAVRRAPKPILEEESLEVTPRRVVYPQRGGRTSRREDVDTEVGVTVAGAYVALAILGFIILAIWHAIGEPGSTKVGRVFGASLLILYVLGLLMGSWGGIWLLVIAFRDAVMQGVLCLCVPLYPVFYMLSRWRETRGIFAMSFAPLGVVILFALFGGYVIGLKGPTTFFDRLGERLDSLVPEVAPRVDSVRLAEAERLCRDYIQAMRSYTEELSRIQSVAPGQLNRVALDGTGSADGHR